MTRVFSAVLVAGVLVWGAACRKPPAAAAPATPAKGVPGQPAIPEPIKPVPAQLPDVLARVNGESVTKADFDRLIKNMEMSAGQPIPAERRDEILRKALDQLVTRTLLSQEAKARNVTVPDAEIEGTLKQMQSQFPNDQAFQKALAERDMTVDKLRADGRVDLTINKMMDGETSTLPGPSDAQVREYYDKNPDKFKNDEVRASHIMFKADEKADAATKIRALTKAQTVLKQVKAGSDFAALARKHSEDASAKQGGDIDFFPAGKLPAPFEQVAFSLQPGQTSEIVTTQFGFHIIKVTDRRTSTVAFDQVTGKVRDFLADQRKQEKVQALIDVLKKKAKIEVLI